MKPLLRRALLLLTLALIGVSSEQVIRSRPSCRRHFLSAITDTRVLPLQLNDGPIANIVCEMPTNGGEQTVTTVIHSGLHLPYTVVEKKTVGFQIRDIDLLQDILRTNQCSQTVNVTWPEVPVDSPTSLTLFSVLGKQRTFESSDGSVSIVLEGSDAGILHILPLTANSPHAPIIQASEIRCEQAVNVHDECLLDGGAEIFFGPGDDSFEFAFRTDQTDQSLFDIYLTEDLVSHVRLEKEFFLRIDGTNRQNVGLLTDGKWHTIKFKIATMLIEVDNKHQIHTKINLDEVKVQRISIKVDGQVLLIHPRDEMDRCISGNRLQISSGRGVASREYCWDSPICGCKILPNHFDSLPSPACKHRTADEENAYHLIRTPDLLSFLYLPDVLSPLSIRTAMTFRSDADSGLLMFGSWKEESEWGRFQIHYHGEKMSAMYCTQNDENTEVCSACAIYRIGGFSTDQWVRLAFYKDLDSYHLMVDREICELKLLTEENEFDTAEMYKTLLTRGSVLFIGGMFHKKVKPGIYKEDFKQKYFENTREKLPSLRGCVKDVFSNGHRINLHQEFEQQMIKTLVSPARKSFGVMRGCGVCPVACSSGSRCRPSTSLRDPEFTCDCSDVLLYGQLDGTCRKPHEGVLSLASSSLNAYRGVLTVPRHRGNLQKMWIKMRMPKVDIKDNTPIIHFFSHGKIMFRIYIDVYNYIQVQVSPEDPQVYLSNAGKAIEREDERIHLIKLERRTPLGTHPSRKFFNLYIDGDRFSVQDPGMVLTNVEFSLLDVVEDRDAGCITDFGISYDYDEHTGGAIEQADLKQLMITELGLSSNNDTCGIEDPFLWVLGPQDIESSPFGRVFDYTPSGRPYTAQLLSPDWLLYSVILTCVLVLFILIIICLYCCVLRNRPKKIDDDKERIVRRRSDDYPVIMRRPTLGEYRDSCISDSLDHSDIRAYDDIRTHKVKIDRESMISFLDPVSDESHVGQATIVRRTDENAPLVMLQEVDQ